MVKLENSRRHSAGRRLAMGSAAVIALLLLATPAAQAQYYYGGGLFGYRDAPAQSAPVGSPNRATKFVPKSAKNTARKKSFTTEKPLAKNAPPPPAGPHHLVVSVKSQRATLYANGKVVMTTPVSTGMAGHSTPTGIFSVIQKNRDHKSNIYSGAPMPYMQRLTWSGIALHQGALPGYPASHGCIRLPEQFANFLWRTTKLGARVIVSREDVELEEISHPRLFQPKPAVADLAPQLRKTIDTPLVRTANASSAINQASDAKTPAQTATPTQISPQAAIDAVKTDTPAGDDVVGELKPTQSTETPAQDKPQDAQQDKQVVRDANADADKPVADKVPVPVETPAPVKAADAPAPAQIVDAQKPADQLAPKAAEAPAPQRADIPNDVLNGFIKAAQVKDKRTAPTGPISVFVSRKEKKLFVRQGFQPLFSMPVKFTDDSTVLGTHIFTALESGDGAKPLKWVVVTLPPELKQAEAPRTDRHGRRIDTVAKAEPIKPALKASDVLDKIELSPEAIDRISEYMTAGASFIVSDHGLGTETGAYTDFIVVTR